MEPKTIFSYWTNEAVNGMNANLQAALMGGQNGGRSPSPDHMRSVQPGPDSRAGLYAVRRATDARSRGSLHERTSTRPIMDRPGDNAAAY